MSHLGGLNQQKFGGGGGLFGQSPSLGGTSTFLEGSFSLGGGGLFSQSETTSASGRFFNRDKSTAPNLGENTGGGLFGKKGT